MFNHSTSKEYAEALHMKYLPIAIKYVYNEMMMTTFGHMPVDEDTKKQVNQKQIILEERV